MSERINMLLESTGSTETAGDDFQGSYVSRSSRSRSDSSGSGSSYSSSKSYTEEEGSLTEADDVSLVDTYTSQGDDDDSSAFSAVEDDDTMISETSQSNPGKKLTSKSVLNSSLEDSSVPEPDELPVSESGIIPAQDQPDLDNRKRNDSNLSASRHFRVPGGAAAKLMFVGPKASSEIEREEEDEIRDTSSTESGKVNATAVNEKLGREMQEAKYEFSMGNSKRRSSSIHQQQGVHDLQQNQIRDDTTDVSSTSFSGTPSFLNRNEIFHKTAAAAVAALLTPRPSALANCTSDVQSVCSSSVAPCRPNSPKSVTSDSGRKTAPQERQVQLIESQSSTKMLTQKAELVLDQLRHKMHDPSPTLTDLLAAIASPENMTNEQIRNDLGYAVRRKNACGVLHVLTSNASNRVKICWTAGVLPALTSVLSEAMDYSSTDEAFPDRRIRDEYLTARIRAISVLTNLAVPAKNKIAVFHTPELIQALVSIIEKDKEGSARRGASALLAMLAKSVDNRILMYHVPGLLEVIREVIHPKPPRVEPCENKPPTKKLYPWSEGDDDDDSEVNSITSMSGSERDQDNDRKNKLNIPNPRKTDSVDGESGSTPRVKGSKTPRELSGYDDTVDELYRNSRQNLFALLGHLVKEKDNAYSLGREDDMIETLVAVSYFKESESHEFAIRILANLTRHRLNKHLAFKPKGFVPALIEATQSPLEEARLHAIYGLQNLSQEKSCRQELAISNNLIVALCDRCRNGEQEAERLAAISTLKNLCDEPANLIPMTNTPGCVSTLMHFAHGGANDGDELPVTEMMQYRACDALSTLSHWLRKISTSGYALEASTQSRTGSRARTTNFGNGQLFVPSLREVSWNQWQ